MRVLFDAFWWFSGPLANRSVQRDLIATWAEEYPGDELIVALRANGPAGVDDLPDGAESVRTRLWPHAVSNAVELPVLARRVRPDITIAHNYTPVVGRTATFIHDTMFVDSPEWFSLAERVYFWPMLPLARRADIVLTSTGTESRRIARQTHDRIVAVPTGLAVPRGLASAEPVRPDAAVALARGYALCVGRLNVRKNLAAVIRGAMASSSVGPDTPLLIVGSSEYSGRGTDVPPEFRAAVEAGSIRFLGRIGDPELAWLYAHASVAVTLSLDEGFGLPAVEAARFAAPLVASDIPVFRETVTGYADFVAPDAPAETVGAAIDRRWGRSPASDARDTVLERYDWAAAVRTLRAALPGG